ncbi:S8 family peptidase [Algoriphagus terrigena]|uniref:S8 family peptidase n=1 Tax=Algoriphagus terrigena TaxID=344884 RepID=UPI00041A5DD3|nr:S8 family serine peptidase [Algoriphagus terrigena]
MQKSFYRPFFLGALIVGISYSCIEQKLEPNVALSEADEIASKNAENINARMLGEDSPQFTLVTGQYIIISASHSLPSGLEEAVLNANGKISALMAEVGVATASSDAPDFATKMAKVPGVQSVIRDITGMWIETPKTFELDESLFPESFDNPNTNTRFPLQWGHLAIHAPEAWAAGYQGEGVTVAVLDGGFRLDHADLSGNIIYAKSFVPGEGAQFVGNGFSHGSHVAGTVAALDNNIGVVGVAPKAKLALIKVLSDAGSGEFSWLNEGILDAVEQDVDVINMSLGAYLPRNGKFWDDNGTPNDPSDDFIVNETKAIQELITVLTRVINYANQKGVTVIAAAGNDGANGNKDKSNINIPSDIPNVLSISATGPMGWALNPSTDLDRFSSYSNYGTPAVTFAAPGGDFALPGNAPCTVSGVTIPCWAFDMVLSVGNIGSYNWSAGTSMASPHAAGVAALIIGKNGGSMSPTQVAAAIKASADDLGSPGRDPLYGMGRINAAKAVGVSY